MATWIYLLSAVLILYISRVEGDFGEKVDSNGTTSSSSTGSDNTPEMMIVPEDGVEVQKAALTAMITQEDDGEQPLSPTITENSSNSPDTSFKNDNTEDIKLQGTTLDETSPSTDSPGFNRIGSVDFTGFQEKSVESTHFESNKLEPIKIKHENDQLKPHQERSQKQYINNDYQQWNDVSSKQANHKKEESWLSTHQLPENKYISNDYIPSWDYLSLSPAQHKTPKSQLELQLEYLQNKYVNNDYLQPWSGVPFGPSPTKSTQAFDYSLNKNDKIHDQDERIKLNLQYQIETAKAYINQIKLEQEYALKSKSLQDSYNGNVKFSQPSSAKELNGFGYGPNYLYSLSQHATLPYTTASGSINLGAQTTASAPRIPFAIMQDGYTINSGPIDWNRSPNNDPYAKVDSFGNNYWNSLNNPWEVNHDKSKSSFSQLNSNQWNNPLSSTSPFQQKLHDSSTGTGVHGPSSYPGPTANPVILPSGYLDETEEVKQARTVHLRAIGRGFQAASQWRGEQPNKSFR